MPQDRTPDPAAQRLAQGRQMAESLGRLLDGARGAREVLPHLAALERGLRDQGLAAVDRVPPHSLRRMCSQLASLPIPPADRPLQDLLAYLLKEADDQDGSFGDNATFHAERTIVIREISHSEFMAAHEEQATTMPMDLPRS